MSGTLTIVGEVSVGSFVPGITGVQAAVLAELRAKYAGYVKALALLKLKPPSLNANIAAVGAMLVAMRALIGVSLPDIDFQLALLERLIADLDARIQLLLGLPFATAGVEAMIYQGDWASFGPTVTAGVRNGPPSGGAVGTDECFAFIAATQFRETFSALGKVLVTP